MKFGIVTIGRNEGDRLRKCLESVISPDRTVVYVDSDSTDDSVETARSLGAHVVTLDMSIPFTAARARNEGFRRLKEVSPGITYAQFVDGDCEISDGWLERATQFLDAHASIAVVCGRLREKFPARSIYNMLCDVQWDAPVGEARTCGGIALMRAEAIEKVHGYRADLICGEEADLCMRLRAEGWQIWRLGEEMAQHDAAIMHFGQWWKRALRGGYGFAQGADLHGKRPEKLGVRESRSAWLWGLLIPLSVIGLALWWEPWALVFFLAYPFQIIRLARQGKRSRRENWLNASFLVLSKFPAMLGQAKYWFHRYARTPSRLIEYK